MEVAQEIVLRVEQPVISSDQEEVAFMRATPCHRYDLVSGDCMCSFDFYIGDPPECAFAQPHKEYKKGVGDKDKSGDTKKERIDLLHSRTLRFQCFSSYEHHKRSGTITGTACSLRSNRSSSTPLECQ
jgi:hypothetical protein